MAKITVQKMEPCKGLHTSDVAKAIRKSIEQMQAYEETGNIKIYNVGGGNPTYFATSKSC